jgi:GT2 family glycosyltransferase
MTSKPPRLSVVIPVYQGEHEIGPCLESVLEQSYPRERYEIVVVDNGSTDGTRDIVQRYPVVLEEEARHGVAAARSAGVARAHGELIVFTDADCRADRNWLESLVARFDRDPDLGGVGGYLASLDPQAPIQYYIAERNLLSQEVALEDRVNKAPFLITANALFPRRLIEEAGGFDPRCVISGEDADLCWRIADRGFRFAFAPDAVVYHRHRTRVGALCRWMFRYGIGSVYLMKKHRRRYGIGRVWFDLDHYELWMEAVSNLLAIRPEGLDPWERRFAGYDVLRFACFTAGRLVGSIRYGMIVL